MPDEQFTSEPSGDDFNRDDKPEIEGHMFNPDHGGNLASRGGQDGDDDGGEGRIEPGPRDLST